MLSLFMAKDLNNFQVDLIPLTLSYYATPITNLPSIGVHNNSCCYFQCLRHYSVRVDKLVEAQLVCIIL